MTPNEKHVAILAKVTPSINTLITSEKNWIIQNKKYLKVTIDDALTAMQTIQEECDATILSMQNRIDELEKENLELFTELNKPNRGH